jgi:hypothetical protein
MSAGAGGASAVLARGGSDPGNINRPPETDEDDAGGGAADDEDEDDADEDEEDDDIGGPQALSAGWYETQRGRRIALRFYIPSRLPPSFPIAFRPESFEHSEIFAGGERQPDAWGRPAPFAMAPPTPRRSPTVLPNMAGFWSPCRP